MSYSKKYDAYYDDATGEWLDNKCSDTTCTFCSTRPERADVPEETVRYLEDGE